MSVRERFESDGYASPIAVLTPAAAARLRAEYEAAEGRAGADPTRRALLRSGVYNLLPAMYEVVTSPAVTGPVAEVLGEDLLLLKCNMFVKEPSTPHYVSWHQDLTYWGLEGDEEVTAWLALSPATAASGCMRFLPGSHRQGIVPHADTFADGNLLTRGQEIAVAVDEAEAVDAELAPGQMSLHHGKLFHASHPNRTADRRIGAAIRFITPRLRMRGGARNCATLVRGEDRYGHFDLLPPPRGVLDSHDLERERHYQALQERFLYEGTERGRARRT